MTVAASSAAKSPASTSSSNSLRAVTYATDAYAESKDGTRIHYYTIGDGPQTLVCCDGLGCDGYVWKYIAQDFASRYRIVRWHYRGHGTSDGPRDRSRMRIQDLVDDLIAVMDAQGIEKPILLGHSLGVQVIFEAQRRHPSRVKGLVPMCGSYGRPLDTFHDGKALKRIFPVLSKLVHRYPEVAQKVWTVLDTELAYQIAVRTEVNGELVKRQDFRPYLKHIGHIDPGLFANLLADAGEHDALPHLEHIDIPTLIIAGERDTFTPPWLSQVMHSRIPGSQLCTIPGGTHTAPIEIPELVTLRLERFLKDHFADESEPALATERAG